MPGAAQPTHKCWAHKNRAIALDIPLDVTATCAHVAVHLRRMQQISGARKCEHAPAHRIP